MRNHACAVVAGVVMFLASGACSLESEAGPSAALEESTGSLALPAWFEANHGIEGADVRALALSPDEPRILYAALPSGGLYKSVNGGLSWRHSDRGLPTMAAYDVAVNGGYVAGGR